MRPGIDLLAERQRREEAGRGEVITEADLYPDVRPALADLRARGLWVGVAGNQTSRAGDLLRGLDLPVDRIATSGDWGVAKPDPDFFARITNFAPGDPSEILYVGDHRDYDVKAASEFGLTSALIKRGPWGHLWAQDPIVTGHATWIVDSLTQLPALLRP